MGQIWATLIALSVLLLGGCSTDDGVTVATDTDPALWRIPVELSFENRDSLSLRNIELFARLDERFSEDTLTVRIETRSPDSMLFSEYYRLLFRLPATATPLRRVAQIPYRRHVVLPRRGRYHVRISPTRRIAGVEAIGMQIKHE